jgi:flagellar hook-associated protein 2
VIGVGLTGLASGLDTEALVAQLMAIERRPRQRLELREGQVEARQAQLRDVLSKLKSLKTAAADLRSVGLWADTQTVDSSDATKVAARRLSGAGPGGYLVEVTQLARAEQRTYDFTPSASASSITIDGVQIDLAENATLDDAVREINGRAESPVYAVNVNGQLVLASRTTGAANGFTASGPTIVEDAAKAKVGLDATYTVDGGAPQTSSSNVVTGAIPGVELTLKGLTAGSVTVTVGAPGPDSTAIKEKVKRFVEVYNETVDLVRGKLTEARVPNATTERDAAKGVLRGDPLLSGILSSLRTSLSEAVGGNPADLDELAELGITTGATTGSGTVSQSAIAGKLVLDEAKLSSLLDSRPSDVRRLLGGVSGVDGFAQRFEGLIDPATTAGGTIDQRLTEATNELDRVRDAMTALDDRLSLREKRLRAQFATLERLLSESQSQAGRIASQLGSLPSSG